MALHMVQRWCLLASAMASFPSTTHVARASESIAPPQCTTQTSRVLSIRDCAGLVALPAPMTEDLSLVIDSVEAIVCNSLVTVTVTNGRTLRLSSDGRALKLSNVRFVVEGGSELRVDRAEVSPGVSRGGATLTFEGTAPKDSDGGVFEVQQGGVAVFLVPVHFEANSVADGNSGGALHVDGSVLFGHAAHFSENRALGEGSCGGAISIGEEGEVVFSKFASFEENSAEQGGALCCRGLVRFSRRSFFDGNSASAGGILRGGDGGAVHVEAGSETVFTRKSTMLRNSATRSGGALFNAGKTAFETSADFRGNSAGGIFRDLEASGVGGGHVFNRGMLEMKGDVSFSEGYSAADGGAMYTLDGEMTMLSGIASFEGNTADKSCSDVFAAETGSEVKLTTIAGQRRKTSASQIRTSPCQPRPGRAAA